MGEGVGLGVAFAGWPGLGWSAPLLRRCPGQVGPKAVSSLPP